MGCNSKENVDGSGRYDGYLSQPKARVSLGSSWKPEKISLRSSSERVLEYWLARIRRLWLTIDGVNAGWKPSKHVSVVRVMMVPELKKSLF